MMKRLGAQLQPFALHSVDLNKDDTDPVQILSFIEQFTYVW